MRQARSGLHILALAGSSLRAEKPVLPAFDPRSKVNPAGLRSTCGQSGCHPQMPETIASSKIHVGPDSQISPALFFVRRILIILDVIALFITVVWFIPGFIKKLRLSEI